jgi:transposase
MVSIGVDIGKYEHEAIVLNGQGEPRGTTLRFSNSEEGFAQFLAYLPAEPRRIAMEATGHYWLNLFAHLTSINPQEEIIVINPLQTEAQRKGQIRRTKTDRRDCQLIAELLHKDDVRASYIPTPVLQEIRDLGRFRFDLVDEIGSLKQKLLVVLDKVFPEFETLFSDAFIQSARQLLQSAPLPEDILAFDLSELTKMLKTASRGQIKEAKVLQIKDAAKHSVGIRFAQNAARLQIRILLDHLTFMEAQVAEIDDELASLLAQQECYLPTMVGISHALGAVIYGELGDIKRFSRVEQLVAFTGIDPTVYESGKFRGTHAHMSKRGSPYLRRAIWLAAISARRFDPELKAYYEKKLAEGKHPNSATGAVCRKLLNRIFVILREKRPYIPGKST